MTRCRSNVLLALVAAWVVIAAAPSVASRAKNPPPQSQTSPGAPGLSRSRGVLDQ
jgi:hypothetical protein